MYYLQIIDICIKSHFSYDTFIEKWCDLISCMCKKFTLYCKEIKRMFGYALRPAKARSKGSNVSFSFFKVFGCLMQNRQAKKFSSFLLLSPHHLQLNMKGKNLREADSNLENVLVSNGEID
jgi:hypothetical protein